MSNGTESIDSLLVWVQNLIKELVELHVNCTNNDLSKEEAIQVINKVQLSLDQVLGSLLCVDRTMPGDIRNFIAALQRIIKEIDDLRKNTALSKKDANTELLIIWAFLIEASDHLVFDNYVFTNTGWVSKITHKELKWKTAST